jgi:probable F420-dependent oxidoreductase
MNFYLRGGFQVPHEVLEMAPLAERCGFAGVTLPDHVLAPVETEAERQGRPYRAQWPMPDVWVLMGALSAVTSTLRFRTVVYILPLRHPALVARAVGTAAVISGGRVELGMGVGNVREEFDMLGSNFTNRGARANEAIAFLRAAWQPGPVSFEGRWYSMAPSWMEPAPPGPIPIYVGGSSEAALKRAAELGDGYMSMPNSMDGIEALVQRLDALHRSGPRRAEPFAINVSCTDASTPQDYRRLEAAGVASVVVTPWGDPYVFPPLADRLRSIEAFAERVIGPMGT